MAVAVARRAGRTGRGLVSPRGHRVLTEPSSHFLPGMVSGEGWGGLRPLSSGGAIADQRPDAELGREARMLGRGEVRRFPGGLPGGLPCNLRLILWVQGCSPWCPLPATGMKRRTHSRCREWGLGGETSCPMGPPALSAA